VDAKRMPPLKKGWKTDEQRRAAGLNLLNGCIQRQPGNLGATVVEPAIASTTLDDSDKEQDDVHPVHTRAHEFEED
jgi:hypothetical protein